MKTKVVILSPHYSEQIFTKAALSIMTQLNYADSLIMPESRSDSLANIRNCLVRQGLETNATHFMWLDGDEIFPIDMIPRLLKHNKDIVAAWTVIRQETIANVYRVLFKNKRGGYKHESYSFEEIEKFKKEKPLQRVDRMGFGSILIKRKVFEKMSDPWFDFTQSHTCEDLYFCDKAREMGYKIYCDFSLKCLHISLTYL